MNSNILPMKQLEKRTFGKDLTNVYSGLNNIDKQNNSMMIVSKNNIKDNVNKNIKEQMQKIQTCDSLKILTGSINKQKKLQSSAIDAIQQYKYDILSYLTSIQSTYRFKPQPSYKFGISLSMRYILRDWLIDVHEAFNLKQKTLHLAFSYLNTYQSLCIKQNDISKQDYQLLGIGCLWIASKYEEIYAPKMNNFVDVTDNTYNIKQLKKMEDKIMQKLQFNMNHVTIYELYQCLVQISNKNYKNTQIQLKSIAFGKYIMQLLLIQADYMYKNNKLTKLLLAILYVCNSVFKTKFQTKLLQNIGQYTKEQIYQCYKQIIMILKQSKQIKSNALKKKYQNQKYYKVGKLKIQLKNQ